MSKFDEISAARKILDLPEMATMAVIKSSYRKMLAKWHPDKCEENEETLKRHQPPEEWWFERFGDDPLWGNGRPPKCMFV